MKRFATRTTIQASPEAVWAILSDAPSYPSWNSTVTKVEGAIALGAKVTVHAKISPDRAFPVKVSTLDAPRKMVWTGGMPIGFLFKASARSRSRRSAMGRWSSRWRRSSMVCSAG